MAGYPSIAACATCATCATCGTFTHELTATSIVLTGFTSTGLAFSPDGARPGVHRGRRKHAHLHRQRLGEGWARCLPAPRTWPSSAFTTCRRARRSTGRRQVDALVFAPIGDAIIAGHNASIAGADDCASVLVGN
jgi:hypothetical protein